MHVWLVWALCDWRPGRPKRRVGARSLVAFGGDVTASNLLSYFSRNADNMLIGWYWGAGPLGIYSRAYQLFMLPVQQINAPLNSVILPALARLQSDLKRFREYYLKALYVVAAIGMPLAALLGILSEEIIQILLGEKWMGVVPVFKVLSVAAVLQPMTNSTGWLFTSLGRTKLMLRWTFIGTLTVVLSFVVGLPYGPVGVALAYAIARFVLIPPAFLIATMGTTIKAKDIMRWCAFPVIATILGATAAVFLRILIKGNLSGLLVMIACTTAMVLVCGVVLFFDRVSRPILRDVVGSFGRA